MFHLQRLFNAKLQREGKDKQCICENSLGDGHDELVVSKLSRYSIAQLQVSNSALKCTDLLSKRYKSINI